MNKRNFVAASMGMAGLWATSGASAATPAGNAGAAAPANAAMVALAVQYLAIAAAFQLFDGTQAVAAGALRGLQDTRMPMAAALFGYWLPGMGTAVFLGFATPLRGSGV